MYPRRLDRCEAAFTKADLLAVAFIVSLLCLLPSFAGNRERANRIVCLNNLRQMALGAQMYAEDDSKGRLTGSLKGDTDSSLPSDDDVNWLYGYGASTTRYVADLRTFICPATYNAVDPTKTYLTFYAGKNVTKIRDLDNNAVGGASGPIGHSYELKGGWKTGSVVRKTLKNVMAHQKQRDPFVGRVVGPNEILLMFDAMEPHVPEGSLREDYPNLYDGHGAEGGNMAFADGHGEWVSTFNWNFRFELSEDDGRQLAPY